MAETKICRETGLEFTVDDWDLDFYARVSPTFANTQYAIPSPTLCPQARQRRRLVFRNERTLYRRTCDHSGQSMLSSLSPEAPMPVYAPEHWFSDVWDPMSFGRPFDFERSFFEQFSELTQAVPMYALHHQAENENCDFTNLVTRNKNCYYIFAAGGNEDTMYGTYMHSCRDSVDCFFCFSCQLCYECIDCDSCYDCRYLQDCENCSESQYLIGCKSCQNCFGCVSLTQASYCIFNQVYSKEDYFAHLEQLLARPDAKSFIAKALAALKTKVPVKNYAGMRVENATGDHLIDAKNVKQCFDCFSVEDCRYCVWMKESVDCMDCYAWGWRGELGLENHLCGNNFFNVLFSDQCWNDVSNILYSKSCYGGCQHLFGCVGLHRKSHCIFNVQYEPEEYEKMCAKIVTHMQNTGEWGEFFPQSLSPYGYNETVAAEYCPASREQVLNWGWNWRDEPLPGTTGKETLYPIPEDRSIDSSICSEVLRCEKSGKNYRITNRELELYKRLDVPIPRLCFDERYNERFKRRNPRVLRAANCEQCGEAMQTSYSAEYPGIIFCEPCYQRSVHG